MIFSHTNILTWVMYCSSLANNNVACFCDLTAKKLQA